MRYSVPEAQRGAVRNHGGGHFNHSLFWEVMGPVNGEMSAELNAALLDAFGSLDDFKAKFQNAASAIVTAHELGHTRPRSPSWWSPGQAVDFIFNITNTW